MQFLRNRLGVRQLQRADGRERTGESEGKFFRWVMLIEAMPVVCFAEGKKLRLPRWLPIRRLKNRGRTVASVIRTRNTWF